MQTWYENNMYATSEKVCILVCCAAFFVIHFQSQLLKIFLFWFNFSTGYNSVKCKTFCFTKPSLWLESRHSIYIERGLNMLTKVAGKF